MWGLSNSVSALTALADLKDFRKDSRRAILFDCVSNIMHRELTSDSLYHLETCMSYGDFFAPSVQSNFDLSPTVGNGKTCVILLRFYYIARHVLFYIIASTRYVTDYPFMDRLLCKSNDTKLCKVGEDEIDRARG